MEADKFRPGLLASTGEKFSCSVKEFRQREKDAEGNFSDENRQLSNPEEPEGNVTNFFKSMQWYRPLKPPPLPCMI
jgi:hypothetical protein